MALVQESIHCNYDESLDEPAKWGPIHVFQVTEGYGTIERSYFEGYVKEDWGDKWGMVHAPQGRKLHAEGYEWTPVRREIYIPRGIPDNKIILKFSARRLMNPVLSPNFVPWIRPLPHISLTPMCSLGVNLWFNVHYLDWDGKERWLWWEDPDVWGYSNNLSMDVFCSRWRFCYECLPAKIGYWEQCTFLWVCDASTTDHDLHYSDTFATLPDFNWHCFEYDVGKALRDMAERIDIWANYGCGLSLCVQTKEEIDALRLERVLGFKLYRIAPTIEAVCCQYKGQIGDIQLYDYRGLSRPHVRMEYPPDV